MQHQKMATVSVNYIIKMLTDSVTAQHTRLMSGLSTSQHPLCPFVAAGVQGTCAGGPNRSFPARAGVHARMLPLGTDRQTYEQYVGVISVVDHV